MRKFGFGQSVFAVSAGVLLLGVLGAQEVFEQQPIAEEPFVASDPGMEQGASTECAGGYTTTTCSLENEKFVSVFSIGALLTAAVGALLLPIFVAVFQTERMGWWRVSPFVRTAWCAGIFWVGALVLLLLLPYLAYRQSLPESIGLLALPGFREGFFVSCTPCSAAVSNYPPFWGWLGSFGMPNMGLAIEHPLSLAIALTLMFLIAIVLLTVLHFAWRRRLGFASLCRKGEVA